MLQRTLIKEKVGYLGPFHDLANPKMVQVGEEQSLWYETPRDLEHGPFHLSSTEQEDKKYNAQIPLPSDKVGPRDKLKGELTEELMETEYGRIEGRNVMSKKLLRDLKKIACNAGINVKKMVTHRTRTGWAGKGKGLLQCLWERGFINQEKWIV